MCVTHVGSTNHSGGGRAGAEPAARGEQTPVPGPKLWALGRSGRTGVPCRGGGGSNSAATTLRSGPAWGRCPGLCPPTPVRGVRPRPRPQDRNPGVAPPSAPWRSRCSLREGPFAGGSNCPVSAAHGLSMSVDPEGPIGLPSPINRSRHSSPPLPQAPWGTTLRSKSWAALTPSDSASWERRHLPTQITQKQYSHHVRFKES